MRQAIIIGSLLFFGCIRTVEDVPAIPDDKKVYVHCILDANTDDNIRVYVLRTTGYYEKNAIQSEALEPDKYYIQNASVIIHDGEKSARLSLESNRVGYSISTHDFPIKEGKTYYLDILANNQRIVAQCTVPYHCVNFKATLKRTDRDKKILVAFSFDKNQAAAYRMEGRFLYPFRNNGKDTLGEFPLEFDSKIKSRQDSLPISYRYYINSDYGLDMIADSTLTLGTSIENKEITDLTLLKNIQITLINFEEYATKYFIDRQMGRDPFGEPNTNGYNIKGGLGIFGAKTTQTIEIDTFNIE